MADLTPVAVLDSGDERTWPPPSLTEVMNWLHANGITPARTYRVEIYLVDTLFAKVFQYAENENGTRYCPVDHDHWNNLDKCEPALREPYVVSLDSMPPRPTGEGGDRA